MSFTEREIKILNIDVPTIEAKVKKEGGIFLGDFLQEIYTYDIPGIKELYQREKKRLEKDKIYEGNIELNRRVKLFLVDFLNVIEDKDEKAIFDIYSVKSNDEILENLKNKTKDTINVFLSEDFKSIVNKYDINPRKWIRLRKTGEQVTLTIKNILNKQKFINVNAIDSVKEYEICVDNLKICNMILENLGFFYRNYQEKRRISYTVRGMNLDFDFWPLIPPYLEIEGEDSEKIYKLAYDLGFSGEDIVIMNTDEVYRKNGLNIYDYKELKFDLRRK